jgi:hypothetical protein
MSIIREEVVVRRPVLFDNFVERRTRGQKLRGAIMTFKFVIKWIINWKGIRG